MDKIKTQLADLWKKNRGFILFISFVVLFRVSIADQYHVPSGSMLPTIHIGDRILVNKLVYNFKIPFTNIMLAKLGEPERGDIVVFEQPTTGTVMVKRLIGLPGDHIEVKFGYVYVNGTPLIPEDEIKERPLEDSSNDTEPFKEVYGDHTYTIQRIPYRAQFDIKEFDVPEDHFFMMGDNRDNSNDSRFWGTVPRHLIKGRAFSVFYTLVFDGFVPKFDFSRIAKSLP
ncbi:MAG: signal peptidase I [Bdellovibrionales bacterium]|nr:signal peptidase I [Bdellovibrionales bacterium]